MENYTPSQIIIKIETNSKGFSAYFLNQNSLELNEYKYILNDS
jgi:hypothetical protein